MGMHAIAVSVRQGQCSGWPLSHSKAVVGTYYGEAHIIMALHHKLSYPCVRIAEDACK